jgi:hypothetical protein
MLIIGDEDENIKRSWPRKGQRTQQNDIALLDTTITWIAGLPKDVRPMVLGRRFPRIANTIAELWRRVARCEEYLNALAVDSRGNRKGFPPEVAQELTNLRSFYAALHPYDRSGPDLVGDLVASCAKRSNAHADPRRGPLPAR